MELQIRTTAPDSPAPATLLDASGLVFAYPHAQPVLNGVDLRVDRGRITMILGLSGSGKTTLLKIMAGLLRPQGGSIRRPAGTRTAYIPQTLGLVRRMTAIENTLCGALADTPTLPSLFKRFSGQTVERARSVLRELEIGSKAEEPVHQLSGGERQRVAIARALLGRPSVIIADEFVSQLDAVTAGRTLDLAKRLAREGTGFVISTHDAELAREYADDVLVLRGARTVFAGPALALDTPKLRELLS